MRAEEDLFGFCVCGDSGIDGWNEQREEGKQTTVYVVCVMCYCLRLYLRMT